MSYLSPVPAELKRVEYAKLYFHLEISDYFSLPPSGLLQLRRELLQALRTLEGWGSADDVEQLKALLQPALPTDPLIRRQAQRPAPALVLYPDPQLHGLQQPKQRIVLPALFLGNGINGIAAFVTLLQQLGQQGLYHGHGQFRLEGVESEDSSGVRAMLWIGGKSPQVMTPPVSDLHWWLERQTLDVEQLILEIVSPLRLLQKKKPLFKAGFADLFPFVLRRVSAMISCHAGVEVVKNPQELMRWAEQVVVLENRLHWQEWRCLEGHDSPQRLGGLLGHLQLAGSALAEIIWLLQLGSLFNLGKSAGYGAGQYRLKTHC